tara:strand:+ start:7910 stop:8173 length:264 start_codon:yes stop_codon:yes gene_type:complete
MTSLIKAATITGRAQGRIDYLKDANAEIAESLKDESYQSIELIERRKRDFDYVNENIQDLFDMIKILKSENESLQIDNSILTRRLAR